MRPMYRLTVACIVGIVAVASATGRHVAAPRIIMLHGGVLKGDRILMIDWRENGLFLASSQAAVNVDASSIEGRATIDVALFWDGGRWGPYTLDRQRLDSLTPDLAQQHGRIYLGGKGFEAILFTGETLASEKRFTRIGRDGLAILVKYGVPTAVD